MTNSHLRGITRSFLLFNVELQLLQIIVINSCSLTLILSLFLSFPPIFHLFSVDILSPSRYYISFFFLILQSSSRYTSNQNSRTYIYVYTFNCYNNRKVTYANTSAKEDHDWNLRYINLCFKHAKNLCLVTKDIFIITFCTCFYFEEYVLCYNHMKSNHIKRTRQWRKRTAQCGGNLQIPL